MERVESTPGGKKTKLGAVSGVYIPVVLNIISILMFLRFGSILGRIGLIGILGLLATAYLVDFITTLSLSAIASNGEVKGGGAYFLISRSLGPEFGGSIGILFYLSQVLNTALNVVGLIDCLKLNLGSIMPHGFWEGYAMETCALMFCTLLSLAGSGIFTKASNGLLTVLLIAALSIPFSALVRRPFVDNEVGVEFTGVSSRTLHSNLYPHSGSSHYNGLETFRELFGVLFPATSGIFAGASMSGDLRNPSRAIPKGTLWAMLSTLVLYLLVILSMAASITHNSFLRQTNVISITSIWSPLILAGECATTLFSVLMGLIGSAKLLQALARDSLLPGLGAFGQGTKSGDEPTYAVLLTYAIAQIALFADLNQIATLISMGYQMTFFVMNLACFLLKIGSAPNFRPAFKFFSWQSALLGSIFSAVAMFFIDETYAATAICLLIFLFLLIHYMSPPKHWGDVSQNLIYHQVRKYLLRLKPEHIKFWRPQIILLINNPRHHTRLIQFCNSMKKGALYILGHVIVTDDFDTGIHEAKLQQSAWTRYISEFSRIKAFVQLTMSPSIEWGVRNLILSAGLGGMRPNIAVLGFYNMDNLHKSQALVNIPSVPVSPVKAAFPAQGTGKARGRRRGDTSARLLEGFLPTDEIRTEETMSVTSYLTIVEDLALKHRLNVAIGKGFQSLETPRHDGTNTKKYIDLWPVQMSAEISTDGQNILTTNFDTYTLILQLGYILHSVPAWRDVFKLRILVFVEYEAEIKEEQARLKGLLEKLRIEADVQVSWLASGQLNTYEHIINGKTHNNESENIIENLLAGDDWWQELQKIRAETANATWPQGNPVVEDHTKGNERRSSLPSPGQGESVARQLSTNELLDLPKKPTMSKIAKLRLNFGIRTHNLGSEIFDDNTDQQDFSSSDDEGALYSADADFNDAASVGDLDDPRPSSHLLLSTNRRKSHGGTLRRPWASKTSSSGLPKNSNSSSSSSTPDYGTMISTASSIQEKRATSTTTGTQKRVESTQALLSPLAEVTQIEDDNLPPTSRPPPSRPPLSRNSSMGRFSSRPVPETRVQSESDGRQRLVFAESEDRPSNSIRSRRNSTSNKDGSTDQLLNIPELLEAYQTRTQVEEDAEARSNYSSQSIPLSFNDIPCRAQHLILNELMRQHSNDTAVLLTTLPIPEEGTCQSEEASLRYLSDVEVLCYDLPPVLLVLSNNMTVTVNL
ncbi:amino acid permease-domain-containing protein [Xylariales sp. PMI_506]|nr:amino acid permease-domain-containing protein [Xylariales sp. PMI_506]